MDEVAMAWQRAHAEQHLAAAEFRDELAELGVAESSREAARLRYKLRLRLEHSRGGKIPHWWRGYAPAKIVTDVPTFIVWLDQTLRLLGCNRSLEAANQALVNADRILRSIGAKGYPAMSAERAATIQAAEAKLVEYLRWAKGDEPAKAEGQVDSGKQPIHKLKRRRRKSDAQPNALTPRQLEAMQIVGECKGNMAEAAKRIGRHRKTVQQHYQAALAKLGRTAVKHATQQPTLDRRGQETMTDDCRK